MNCRHCGDLAGARVCPGCQTEIHYLVEDLIIEGEPAGLSAVFDVDIALADFAPRVLVREELGIPPARKPQFAAIGQS